MAVDKETLWHAEALAEFSNLEPQDVERFRAKYPDFVPQKWWDYVGTSANSKGDLVTSTGKQWQMNQRFLREAWDKHFTGELFFIIRLTMSVFDPDELLDVAFGFNERPSFATLSELPWGTYPHQKAVLFLHQQPWRARFCAECKKRFVAAEPKNKYCSDACSHENRNRQKRKWFNEHGSEQRAARRRKANRRQKKRRRARLKS